MTIEEWSKLSMFTSIYRRSDALRDILSGAIRVHRDARAGRDGLAALQISRSDFLSRAMREKVMADRSVNVAPFKVRSHGSKLTKVEAKVKRASENDRFRAPGMINALLVEMWPNLEPLDFASSPILRRLRRCDADMSLGSIAGVTGQKEFTAWSMP